MTSGRPTSSRRTYRPASTDGPGEARLAAMVRQASIPVLETPLNNQLSLMLQSGFAGFALVFLVLALFLELRLAFWVSLGIPISFLGANRAAAEPRLSPSTCCRCFVLVLGSTEPARAACHPQDRSAAEEARSAR